MEIRKYLIAGGNSTALVQDCPTGRRKDLAVDLLREVEQVGFLDRDSNPPQLEMMGGEFCINASLAFAADLGGQGRIKVSGLEQSIAYSNDHSSTAITVPLWWSRRHDNIILLQGIGFILLPLARSPTMNKEFLAKYCLRFSLPAFGAVLFSKSRIIPYVHVAAVDSFITETACGSGSVAYSIFSGINRIEQPAGGVIAVSRAGEGNEIGSNHDIFFIEAEVASVGSWSAAAS